MNLVHGPDGSIWVVDYYREIIEDYSAIPRHLQQQYTLDELRALTPRDVQPFIRHSAESVRVHALQLADRWFAKEGGRAVLDATLAAATIETSPRVLIQIALSLGESRDSRAFAMLARYAREKPSVRWMDVAVLASLHGRSGELLAELIREPGAAAALIPSLAQSIAARRNETELAQAINFVVTAKSDLQSVVLNALANGRKNAPRKPLGDVAARKTLATLAASPQAEVRKATRALEDTFLVTVADNEGLVPAGQLPPVETVSDETFRKFVAALAGPRDVERGHTLFVQACATCHRIGKEGHEVGPDLVGQIGLGDEALIKDLLMPNDRIRPGYETTLLQLADGGAVTGILREDGATSITLMQPNGVERVLLRKDVTGVRRLAGSLMPSFAEGLPPVDMANVLAWLRGNLKTPKPVQAMLFDDEPGFASLLNEGAGSADVISAKPRSGARCLSITPPQRYSARLPGWKYRIVEKPSTPDEFRYLRLAWRATGDGVMLELAANGPWPKADDPRRRYFAGKNTTSWKAHEVRDTLPVEWRDEIFDLWKDCGDFTLTGLAPTAMGGTAFFDRIELIQQPVQP